MRPGAPGCYTCAMDPGTREAWHRTQLRRRGWWMVRRDDWAPGRWALTMDPYAEPWDWRIRLSGGPSHIEARFRTAYAVGRKGRRIWSDPHKVCTRAGQIADRLRAGAPRCV